MTSPDCPRCRTRGRGTEVHRPRWRGRGLDPRRRTLEFLGTTEVYSCRSRHPSADLSGIAEWTSPPVEL